MSGAYPNAYIPADKFSCFMRVKEIHVLSDDCSEQFLSYPGRYSLPCYGQHCDVDKG